MNIINANLSFPITPALRDTDFYSTVGMKVLVINDNESDIYIDFMHQSYQQINFTGIPFHYVVMQSGIVYLARPRVYQAE